MLLIPDGNSRAVCVAYFPVLLLAAAAGHGLVTKHPRNTLFCFRTAEKYLTAGIRPFSIRLKILQISSAESLGGGERYLVDLTNSLVDRGHELYAAVRPGSPIKRHISVQHNRLRELALRNSFDAVSARQLSTIVKTNRIEIIHAHMARDYPLATYAVARNQGARLIVTRHVLFPLSRLHRITMSQVARVIAVSRAVAEQLRSEGLVPVDRIAVVPNGVSIQRFESVLERFDRSRFLASWHLPQSCLLVGTVGQLTPLKGQEEFLVAASEISKTVHEAYFVVAGIDSSREQRYRRHLEKTAAKLGLKDRVLFIDWLDEIAELYCALDVFVSASHTESFGLAIAEAMACHTAVVATETAGAKEIVSSGESGILVPIRDAATLASEVTMLLQNQSLRRKLANRGAERIRESFNLERMVTATERIYREALADKSQQT